MKDTSKIPHWDKPMAAAGLTSYRYRHGRTWVMIGAPNAKQALNEALRSISRPLEGVSIQYLEVWNGSKYEAIP